MSKVEEYRYKIHNIQPPRITPDYEVKYDFSKSSSSTSKIESYVTKKVDLEIEAGYLYQVLEKALLKLNKEELMYFREYYYNKLTETKICHKYYMSKDKLKLIKESCIIKIAMEFDISVEK